MSDDNVTDLDAFRPHCVGETRCLHCEAEHVMVWPAAVERLLECPNCRQFACVPIEAFPWVSLWIKECKP